MTALLIEFLLRTAPKYISGPFRRRLSTAKSTEDRLEWWEKKKGYADSNQQARQSPVIPALRNRMNAVDHAPSELQNDHDVNNADDINARAAESHRSRSSPRYQPLASSRYARSTGPPSSRMQTQHSNRSRPQTLRSGTTSARKTSS
uniref:Uncharacterized protein n=1 Tax=Ascaris lumbricoides TaxID=6252 RepID=A0A0M3HU80_ASCLU